MTAGLNKIGIFLDEVDKIRILDPEIANETIVLKEECKRYVQKLDEFRKMIDVFITLVDRLGEEVDQQKIEAISARNMLQTMEKQGKTDQQQLRALNAEKGMELERLKNQHNSLLKAEMQQNEIIASLTSF